MSDASTTEAQPGVQGGAVRLVRERGVTLAQAARDLDVSQMLIRNWVRQFLADPKNAFPGQGQQKPEDAELTRLRREIARLKMQRDIRKKVLHGIPGSD